MTEREAVDRLLNAIRAASPLLRHGFSSEAAAVLEDAEREVREAMRARAPGSRDVSERDGA